MLQQTHQLTVSPHPHPPLLFPQSSKRRRRLRRRRRVDEVDATSSLCVKEQEPMAAGREKEQRNRETEGSRPDNDLEQNPNERRGLRMGKVNVLILSRGGEGGQSQEEEEKVEG